MIDTTTDNKTNKMVDQTLLARARFDDLPNSENVKRFLKSIENIIKANDESENLEIFEIVCGKLIQSADLWFDNCKICNRKNHRTIDCFHKRSNGCFNCGQGHVVRDCPMAPNFQ